MFPGTLDGTDWYFPGLENLQTDGTNLDLPWQITFDYTGATPELSSATVKVFSISYFDANAAGNVDDNCDDVEVLVLSDNMLDNICHDPDFSNCSSMRQIVYTAEDQSGNRSDTCTFRICFEKKTLADITVPTTIELDCSDLSTTDLGEVLLMGMPFDYQDNLCKFNVQFTDTNIPKCGSSSYIIDRTWTIVDWCTAEILTANQLIKITDEDPPQIVCPQDNLGQRDTLQILSTYDCLADLVVRPFDFDNPDETTVQSISDDCTDIDDLTLVVEFQKNSELDAFDPTVNYRPAINNGDGTWVIRGLEQGLNWIRYVVSDECGNVSSCFYEVEVIDGEAPFAVCDKYTTVTLQDNGWGLMNAFSLDDGSYDSCDSPLIYTGKRVDAPHPCASFPDFDNSDVDADGFSQFLQFCCADAGDSISVIMKVTDSGGNYSTCTVSVVVQDKAPVSLPTPYDETVNCYDYDEDDFHGYPDAFNACGNYPICFDTDYSNLNLECGQGYIVRTLFYKRGGELVATGLTDTIWLTRPFYDIEAPSEVVLDNCENIDDIFGLPTINNVVITNHDLCANISYRHEDQIFKRVDGYCLKIIRTWIVIDHCVYDPNSGSTEGYWSDTQVIKVSNSAAPILEACPEDEWYNPDPGTCSKTIDLDGPDAVDACLGESIDEDDYRYEVWTIDTSDPNQIYFPDDQLIAEGTGRDDRLDLTLEAYRVKWFVTDLCGNMNSCEFIVDIIDEKLPTPYCYGGITTVVMDSMFSNGDPMIEIWASDFDLGSTDDCDNDLTFAFSDDVTDTNRTFTCDDLGTQIVRIYVIDDSGNFDFCETSISIQANGDNCEGGVGPRIAGKVETENKIDVLNVNMSLENMTMSTMDHNMTNTSGLYAFDDINWNEDYNIGATKNDNYLNGVSTLDLVLIQRHILGLENLASPYKVIAADVDNSASVSAIDLIELRKLILGIYEELPNNESWRFVDAGQSFTNDMQPWPFLEEIYIAQIGSDMMSNDFIAVKIGDVTENADPNYVVGSNVSSRSSETLILKTDAQRFNAGEEVAINVFPTESNEIYGMQFSLEFDPSVMTFESIASASININEDNLGLQSAADGVITLSWNTQNTQQFDPQTALFALNFKAIQSGDNSSIVINSLETAAEAYNSKFETMGVGLEINNKLVEQSNLKLYQNTPNPFENSTLIDFFMPEGGVAIFEVFDVTGKIITKSNNFFEKGMQTIEFSSNQLNSSGVLYYKISTEKETATKKMLLIK